MKLHHVLPVFLTLFVSSCAVPRQLEKGIADGNERLVSSALASGEDPNEVRGGMPPIMRAAAVGNDRIVKILLENAADMYQVRTLQASQVNAFPQFRWRESGEYCDSQLPCIELSYDAACAAARGGHERVLRLLLKNGLDVNKATPHPAVCAMQAESPLRVLKTLEEAGVALAELADVSLMHQAAIHRKQSVALISYLSRIGVGVEQPLFEEIANRVEHWAVAQGQPPLVTAIRHGAAIKGNYEAIKALLDHGASRRGILPDGNTPLSIAISANCRACIVQLISVDSVLNKSVSDALPTESLALKLSSATDETIRFANEMRVFSSLSEEARVDLQEELNRRRPGSQIRLTEGDYNAFFWQKNSYLDVLPKEEVAYFAQQNERLRRDAGRQHATIRKSDALKKRNALRAQREAGRVIDSLIEQNPTLSDVLTDVADGKALCRHSSHISTGIKRFSCEYMTEGRYREFGKSEGCQRAKNALSQQASANTLSICDASKAAEARLVDALSNAPEKVAMRQRIARSGSGKWSLETVERHFEYPVDELQRLRDEAKAAQERQLKENTEKAWAGFSNVLSASSTAYSQSPMAMTFKKVQQRANQLVIDRQMLQAAQRSANGASAQARARAASGNTPVVPQSADGRQRQANAERCAQQGGRFDASRNNCTITTHRTTAIVQGLGTTPVMAGSGPRQGSPSANPEGGNQGKAFGSVSHGTNNSADRSGLSSGGDNQHRGARPAGGSIAGEDGGWKWTTRTDCGSTHFDDVMPEKDTVCTNAAIPQWQILWRNKPLLGGIHIAVFAIENSSDFPLTFELVGRASGDMETKNFEWKVTVPPHSTRSYPGGIAQLEEPIHNLELLRLRYREPVL